MNIKGFTLIELLVVVSIMLVILGGGIASFLEFNDKQQVTTAVKDVQTMLRAAQIKAKTGEGARECIRSDSDKLDGYRVRNEVLGTTVYAVMERVCLDGSTYLNVERSRSTLTGVTTSSFDMIFHSLKGGVDGAGTITVNGTNSGSIYTFEVSDLGEITAGEYQ